MSAADQLLTGLELTAIGMVAVFLLLTLMVLVIGWMSRLAHRLAPPRRQQMVPHPERDGGQLDSVLVSVITAAVHRYRKKHR